jgi:hypothetical protein
MSSLALSHKEARPKYSYTQLYFIRNASVTLAGITPEAGLNTRIPDEHSALVPPLPIPNRAVKRCCADDSMDYPCESRSSSGPPKKGPGLRSGLFALTTDHRPEPHGIGRIGASVAGG